MLDWIGRSFPKREIASSNLAEDAAGMEKRVLAGLITRCLKGQAGSIPAPATNAATVGRRRASYARPRGFDSLRSDEPSSRLVARNTAWNRADPRARRGYQWSGICRAGHL